MTDRAAFSIRMPEDLKQWLQDRASENGRSVNSEITQVLKRVRADEATVKAA